MFFRYWTLWIVPSSHLSFFKWLLNESLLKLFPSSVPLFICLPQHPQCQGPLTHPFTRCQGWSQGGHRWWHLPAVNKSDPIPICLRLRRKKSHIPSNVSSAMLVLGWLCAPVIPVFFFDVLPNFDFDFASLWHILRSTLKACSQRRAREHAWRTLLKAMGRFSSWRPLRRRFEAAQNDCNWLERIGVETNHTNQHLKPTWGHYEFILVDQKQQALPSKNRST